MENKEKYIEDVASFITEHSPLTWLSSIDLSEALYNAGYTRRRQGRWVLNHGIIDYCTCSCCGSMISQSQLNRFFCPTCGAEMHESEESA
jgi:hypothetical protein